jgi:prolyl-tRNA editing enzyme YbaK/EbsC (Cys-tRNA(Pro) deacylase)
MSHEVLNRVRARLTGAGVSYREIEHAPTRTSEESARARGEPLSVGAKALLLRVGDTFRLFVLPAHRRLDSAAVKRYCGTKSLRFATSEELLALTGLVPGSVPPFGEPILSFELFADEAVGAEHGRVAFNAGALNHSIVMATADWEAVAQPKKFAFAMADSGAGA